jgi:hypothetical protein
LENTTPPPCQGDICIKIFGGEEKCKENGDKKDKKEEKEAKTRRKKKNTRKREKYV